MERYLPEGCLWNTVENTASLKSTASLQESWREGRVLEGRVTLCDSGHNLIVDLISMKGIIPKEEGAIGIQDGSTKDIALISRVNKVVCFRILRFDRGPNGEPIAILSRRQVQEECMERYVKKLHPGDIIPVRVTHLEPFGAFVDVGCGIPSLIPIDAISVSRISHPSRPVFSRTKNPGSGASGRTERTCGFKPQRAVGQLGGKCSTVLSRRNGSRRHPFFRKLWGFY